MEQIFLKSVKIQADAFPTSDAYPFNLGIIKNTKEIKFRKAVTFFVGENGSGKSTLLKSVARCCNIHIWRGVDRARVENNPFEDELHTCMQAEWYQEPVKGSFFAAEYFNHYAQMIDEWAVSDPKVLDYFGNRSLMTRSHGQSHMQYFLNRYRLKGIYFLDEPENALSPTRQIEFAQALENITSSGGAQFVIATHSPILLALPGASILSFNGAKLETINYEDTDHYQVYRNFMENRHVFFKKKLMTNN